MFNHLRYIDFIVGEDQTRALLLELENLLTPAGLEVSSLAATPDQSGPKLHEAVSTFADGRADFGRI